MADQDPTQEPTQSQDPDQEQEQEQGEGDHTTFCFEIPRDLLEPLEKCLTLADAELQLNRDPGDVYVSWLTPREGLETTDLPIDCKTCATHLGYGVCTTHPPGRWISSKLFVNLFTELTELSDAFTNLEITLSADVPRFAILFEVIAVRASSIMRLAQLFVNADSEDLPDYIRREPSEDVLTSASCNGIPGGPLIHGKTLLAAFEWAEGQCEPEDEDDDDDDDKNSENGNEEDSVEEDSDADSDDSDDSEDSSTPDDDEEGEWEDSEWSD